MKKAGFTLFVLFIIAGSVFSGAVIDNFKANTSLNQVELEWTVKSEYNVKEYKILRSLDKTSFEEIDRVAAEYNDRGEHTYTYVDDKIFKSQGNTFYYKLEIVHSNGTVSAYGELITVSTQTSSSRHTWGSLKAMFR